MELGIKDCNSSSTKYLSWMDCVNGPLITYIKLHEPCMEFNHLLHKELYKIRFLK